MNYKLKFLPTALKEWKKLSVDIREHFKKKLTERVITPRIPSDQLRGFKDVYKIKLRSSGYRLVYEVNDNEIVIYVIAVGKRDRDIVYKKAKKRN